MVVQELSEHYRFLQIKYKLLFVELRQEKVPFCQKPVSRKCCGYLFVTFRQFFSII